jgi:chromosome segregation ATPase
MRIEGHSRIGQEARAMGAVVVTLDSNRYAVGLDDAGGAVAVASVDEMPAVVEALLADPGRLSALRERAMRSAREQVDWSTYVRRVGAALARDDDDSARAARGQIGERIRDGDEAARERERALEAAAREVHETAAMLHREVAVRDRRLTELESALHEANSAAWHQERELETVKLEREQAQVSVRDAQRTVDMIRSTRIWRTAMAWYRVRGRFGRARTP